MWTSAFVHRTTSHLLGNLVGYIIAIVPAWLLAVSQGDRRRFWFCVVVVLFAFPIPLAIATDLGFKYFVPTISASSSLGFSGVVGGFTGLLFGFLTGFFAHRYGVQSMLIGTVIVVLSLLGALFEYHGLSGLLWVKSLLGSSIALGGIVLLVDLASRSHRRTLGVRNWLRSHGSSLGLIAGSWVALTGLTILLFPRPNVAAGVVPNIIVHSLGFAGGYAITLIVLFVFADSAESQTKKRRRKTRNSPLSKAANEDGRPLRDSVAIKLTRSVVPQRLPQTRLPDETKQAFVRPVLKHCLQIEYEPVVGQLEMKVMLQPTSQSELNQSFSGSILLPGHKDDRQSVSVPIAETYLTTTFVPQTRVLNPDAEEEITEFGLMSMMSIPDGGIRTRPPGSLDHLNPQTYSWLQSKLEPKIDVSNSRSRPHARRQLPQTEYLITVQSQKPAAEQDCYQQFDFNLSSPYSTISAKQVWNPEWRKYQPLPTLFRTISSRHLITY
ncbi:MFS transporter [Halorussus salinisoli]|uniref:MFS transporter n=1 Tax=Halorussus salinisoli TaxID=2558242 RepID=UPI0010C228AD|nr:MFS transporter [Halorussus salinisoli]